MFGQKPLFGTSSSFGQGSLNPQLSTNIFGATSSQPNIAQPFGLASNVATPFFGSPASQSSNLFGSSLTSSAPNVNPLGGSGIFGNLNKTMASTPLFGAQPAATPAFNFGSTLQQQPSMSTGGLFGFGATPSVQTAASQPTMGLFGSLQNPAQTPSLFGATSTAPISGTPIKYKPTTTQDTMLKNGLNQSITAAIQCISAMKEYENKSLEELRWEDYVANRKFASPTQASAALPFGATPLPAAPSSMFGGFGQPKATIAPFGGSSLFGTPQPVAATTAPTPFGQSFGQQNSFLGSATSTAPPSLFGMGSSLFGQPQAAPTGPATNTSIFGAAPTSLGTTGLFGATPGQTPFGSTGLFGAPTAPPVSTSASAFNFGFGASKTSVSATPSLFGNAAPSALTSAAPSFNFGAPSAMTSATPSFNFGAPAALSSATPSFNFGAPSAMTSATPSFNFGAAPAPLFGGAATSLFPSAPASSSFATPGFPSFGVGAASSLFPPHPQPALFQPQQPTPAPNPFGSSLFAPQNPAPLPSFNPLMPPGINLLGAVPLAGTGPTTYQPLDPAVHKQIMDMVNFLPYGDVPLTTTNTSYNFIGVSTNSASSGGLNFSSLFLPPKSIGSGNQVDSGKGISMSRSNLSAQSLAHKSLMLQNRYKHNPLSPMAISPALKPVNSSSEKSQLKKLFDTYQDDGDDFVPRARNNTSFNSPKSFVLRSGSNDKTKRISPNESTIEETLKTTPAVARGGIKNFTPTPRSTGYKSSGLFNTDPPVTPLSSPPRPNRDERMSFSDSIILPSRDKSQSPVLQSRNASSDMGRDRDHFDSLVRSPFTPPRDRPLFTCTKSGYYTIPSLEECECQLEEGGGGECYVEDFIIGRRGYGTILFPGRTDVTGIDVDADVHIGIKDVEVYPDDLKKPPFGLGLNKRAQITLENTWPIDNSTGKPMKDVQKLIATNYQKKLEIACAKMEADFLEYTPATGTWVFMVPHFTRYQLLESDEEMPVAKAKDFRDREKMSYSPTKLQSPPLHGKRDEDELYPAQHSKIIHPIYRGIQDASNFNTSSIYPHYSDTSSPLSPPLKTMKISLFDSGTDKDLLAEDETPQELVLKSKTFDLPKQIQLHNYPSPPVKDEDRMEQPYESLYGSYLKTLDVSKYPVKEKEQSAGAVMCDRLLVRVLPDYSLLKYDAILGRPTKLKFGNENLIDPHPSSTFRASWGGGPSNILLLPVRMGSSITHQRLDLRNYRTQTLLLCRVNDHESADQDLSANAAETTLKAIFKRCVLTKSANDSPTLTLIASNNANFSLKNARTLPSYSVATSQKDANDEFLGELSSSAATSKNHEIWSLIKTLWGQYEPFGVDPVDHKEMESQSRKMALIKWLVKQSGAQAIQTSDSDLEAIVRALSVGDLDVACELSIRAGYPRLALLLAQGQWSSTNHKAWIAHQLMEWREFRAWSDQLEQEEPLIGRPLARIFEICAGTYGAEPCESATRFERETLRWTNVFGLCLGYTASHLVDNDVAQALNTYEKLIGVEEMALFTLEHEEADWSPFNPVGLLVNSNAVKIPYGPRMMPVSFMTTPFHLLRLFCRKGHPLKNVLSPLSQHPHLPHDYITSLALLAYFQYLGYNTDQENSALTAIITNRVSAQLYPSLTTFSSTPNSASWMLFTNFFKGIRAKSDENVNAQTWETLVRLSGFLDDLLLCLVSFCDSASSEELCYQLATRMKVSKQYLHVCRALASKCQGNKSSQCWYLIKAGSYEEAHALFINYVAPMMIINRDDGWETLTPYLEALNKPSIKLTIKDWEHGGSVYVKCRDYNTWINSIFETKDVTDVNLAECVERVLNMIGEIAKLPNEQPFQTLAKDDMARPCCTSHLNALPTLWARKRGINTTLTHVWKCVPRRVLIDIQAHFESFTHRFDYHQIAQRFSPQFIFEEVRPMLKQFETLPLYLS